MLSKCLCLITRWHLNKVESLCKGLEFFQVGKIGIPHCIERWFSGWCAQDLSFCRLTYNVSQGQLVLDDDTFDHIGGDGTRELKFSSTLVAWGGPEQTTVGNINSMLNSYGVGAREVKAVGASCSG